MNNLENVNVGDKLFVSNGWIGYLETVERLTNTLVITKVHRFARKSGRLSGSTCWDALYARIATDEDVAKVRREQMIRKCRDVDFSILTNTQLEQILEIANNHIKLDGG